VQQVGSGASERVRSINQTHISLTSLRNPWGRAQPRLPLLSGKKATFLRTQKFTAVGINVSRRISVYEDDSSGTVFVYFKSPNAMLLLALLIFFASQVVLSAAWWPITKASAPQIVVYVLGAGCLAEVLRYLFQSILTQYCTRLACSQQVACIERRFLRRAPRSLVEAPFSRCAAITIRGIRFAWLRGHPKGVFEVKGIVVGDVVWFYGMAKGPRRVPDPDWLPPEMPRVRIRSHMVVL
jgi:hypothetical protein